MPRKVKVISLKPANSSAISLSQEDDSTVVRLADEVERTIEPVSPPTPPTPPTPEPVSEVVEDPASEADSGELEALVEEAYKEQRKKRLAKDQQQCQHCNKKMSSKALKYSHDKFCKSHPENQPKPVEVPVVVVPPPPPEVVVEADIPVKPKRKPPVRKPKATLEVPPPQATTGETLQVPEPMRQTIEDFIEQNRTQRQQLRQMRINSLRSQAF
jgi:hypothetical protein